MKHGYWPECMLATVRSFVGPTEVAALNAAIDQVEIAPTTTITAQNEVVDKPCNRACELRWVPEQSTAFAALFIRLDVIVDTINKLYFDFAIDGPRGVRKHQVADYTKGDDRFESHMDWNSQSEIKLRKMTAVLQLSRPEECIGAQLEIAGANDWIVPPRELGALCIFPSFVYHRVTPVTVGRRRTLAAWYTGKEPLR